MRSVTAGWAPSSFGVYVQCLTRVRRSAGVTLRKALSPEGIRREYSSGIANQDLIVPEGYTLDAALIERPGKRDIQLDLFFDYANNVKLYPAFQEYFRKSQPPLLAIWECPIRISFQQVQRPSSEITKTRRSSP